MLRAGGLDVEVLGLEVDEVADVVYVNVVEGVAFEVVDVIAEVIMDVVVGIEVDIVVKFVLERSGVLLLFMRGSSILSIPASISIPSSGSPCLIVLLEMCSSVASTFLPIFFLNCTEEGKNSQKATMTKFI